MGLFEERDARVRAAIDFQPVDKIPLISGGPAAMAAYEGVKLRDYIDDMELCCTTNLKFCNDFNMDGTQAAIFNPRILPGLWLSEVTLPGDKGLSDNELWQIEESERMQQEDYDKILEMGFEAWMGEFIHKEYGSILEEAAPYFQYMPTALKRFREGGVPSYCDNTFASPFEAICGARSLGPFLMDDLTEIPEKLEEVFDLMHKENMAKYTAICSNPETKPNGVWVGGWRGTPSMLAPAMFEQFSWKYMRDYIDLCIQYDVVPICHLDSNWDKGIKYFLELPRHKIILALDGMTDIFKAREVLGDHSCIMGDVPAQMLAFGTTEETYNYCMRLIKEVGPQGFILCSGCDVPFNANFDNVRQMTKSVEDYSKK